MKPLGSTFVLAFLLAVASSARSQENAGPIHELLADHLKRASGGEHVELAALRDDIQGAVAAEISRYMQEAVESENEVFLASAVKVKVSKEELADSIEQALIHELTRVNTSNEDAAQLRATLNRMNLRIAHDYTLEVGAIPAEQTSVRIRLPKLHACQGCKKMLEKALNETDGFGNAVVNLKTNTAQFIAQANLQIEQELNNLEVANVKQLVNWELIRK